MLEVTDLEVSFSTRLGLVRAVDGVSISLQPGSILGVVGESGSGKSTLLLAILGLLPGNVRAGGSIVFGGRDLMHLSPEEMRGLRGREMAMVFQDPISTLNPVYTVGEQIREAMAVHRYPPGAGPARQKERVLRLLEEVGIPHPEQRYRNYPHQFSGGMQQRVLIAMALACEPRLLLLDEPTTALDVTIQAQITELLLQINRNHGTSMILVTHNLALAAEFCTRIAVMYAGRLVESGPTAAVLEEPLHPYTRGLLRSLPRVGVREELATIPGSIPDLLRLPPGCSFQNRCREAQEECRAVAPPLLEKEAGHYSRCVLEAR